MIAAAGSNDRREDAWMGFLERAHLDNSCGYGTPRLFRRTDAGARAVADAVLP